MNKTDRIKLLIIEVTKPGNEKALDYFASSVSITNETIRNIAQSCGVQIYATKKFGGDWQGKLIRMLNYIEYNGDGRITANTTGGVQYVTITISNVRGEIMVGRDDKPGRFPYLVVSNYGNTPQKQIEAKDLNDVKRIVCQIIP